MKRILIFSTTYEPFVGGAEVAVREITNRNDEVEFHMITPRYKRSLARKERIGNIDVHRFGFGFWFDKYLFALIGGYAARMLHKKHTYNGAWCMMANYAGFACEQFARLTNVPYLLTLQQGESLTHVEQRAKLFRKRFERIFAQARLLQAISTFLLDWGKAHHFGGEGVVIPNGVDTQRFTAPVNEEKRREVRQSFGFSDDAFVLVTASRLARKNAITDVVRALAVLPERVCFVICGTGEEEKQTRELVQELGLSKRVLFKGNVSHDELPIILKASDAFIRPSLTEGLGNSFLEAMAAEVTTIGTMVGGIPDFLQDGKNGFAVEPGNPESIAKTVQKVTSLSSEEKQTITQSARTLVEQQYNWNTVAAQMKTLFTKLCA